MRRSAETIDNVAEGMRRKAIDQVAEGIRLVNLSTLQEEQASVVHELLRDAHKLYLHRGYAGTIDISSRLLTISESASLSVHVSEVARAPWEGEATEEVTEVLWATDGSGHVKDYTHRQLFETLLARLERRARSWADATALDETDQLLGASTTLGFSLPLVYTHTHAHKRAHTHTL